MADRNVVSSLFRRIRQIALAIKVAYWPTFKGARKTCLPFLFTANVLRIGRRNDPGPRSFAEPRGVVRLVDRFVLFPLHRGKFILIGSYWLIGRQIFDVKVSRFLRGTIYEDPESQESFCKILCFVRIISLTIFL